MAKAEEEVGLFEKSVQFYRANHKALLEKYEGCFIAILEERVVDSDEDFSELARRVYGRIGYRDIFMPKVERESRLIHLPSPRLRRG